MLFDTNYFFQDFLELFLFLFYFFSVLVIKERRTKETTIAGSHGTIAPNKSIILDISAKR